MFTSFLDALRNLISREPVRILYIAGIAAQALYAQITGGATWENAAIAVLFVVVGEIQRSQVSPAG